ncbi:MAG: hypothetical protein WC372_06455 [Candidatus Neomarinimicrobiota bacterium]|jgi:hypothetical protein|nr:hypothetical protein [Candidatus Neomarinimicrobiota bacterium]
MLFLFVFLSSLAAETLPGFKQNTRYGEQTKHFFILEDVEVLINAPGRDSLQREKETLLIFYACPAGNTIAQTAGKLLSEGDDWHYDIQHIAAQTRFLRQAMKNRNIVTVYLQNSDASWSRYDDKHPQDYRERIQGMVGEVLEIFNGFHCRICLNGHSAGGSWVLGYLSAVDTIPANIDRIVFIDSNYNYKYNADRYDRLFAEFLTKRDSTYLCVLAYNDNLALYHGKSVVSPEGGTWWNTQLMKVRLGKTMNFTAEEREYLTAYRALNGRVQIWLKENPFREILHTTQVYRNGFIHSILCGTKYDELAYQYYGPPVYEAYIYPGK